MITKMSNTTRLVDKLILKGFVDRSICPSNRRKVEIRITKPGEEILLELDKAMQKAEERILNNLNTKDLEELNKLLDKF